MAERLLDCPIQLQRATLAANSLNEKIPSWSNLGPRIMSERTYKSAGEGFAGQQIQATLVTRFVIRWSSMISDLNPKDRLIDDDGQVYSILGVYPLERKQWFEIHGVAKAD